jgi:hypothetical protein
MQCCHTKKAIKRGTDPALMDPAKLSEIYSCRVERLDRDGITALVCLP